MPEHYTCRKEWKKLFDYQAYCTLRIGIGRQKTTWQKLLLAMQYLDALERDYQECYPDSKPPIDGGFEEALRRMIMSG